MSLHLEIYPEVFDPSTDLVCKHGTDFNEADDCLACDFEIIIEFENCDHDFEEDVYANPNSGGISLQCQNCQYSIEQSWY